MKTLKNPDNYGATLAEAAQHLRNLEPFHTGTLSGVRYTDGSYEVYSYGRTIAYSRFIGQAELHPFAYNHSVTTSKHANIVKKAWGL